MRLTSLKTCSKWLKSSVHIDANFYEIEDHEGEAIIGNCYEEELSGVNEKNDVYRIERIVKRKEVKGKKMMLVKWLGYDIKHNS